MTGHLHSGPGNGQPLPSNMLGLCISPLHLAICKQDYKRMTRPPEYHPDNHKRSEKPYSKTHFNVEKKGLGLY